MKTLLRNAPGIALAYLCGLAVYYLPPFVASVYVAAAVMALFNAMRVDVVMAKRRLSSSTTESVVLAAIWPVLFLIYFITLTWDLLFGLGRLLIRPFKRT